MGDHIVRRNCVKLLARSFPGEARYLFVYLRFGLEVNKYVFAFLCCLGSFSTVRDIEYTALNINIFRMLEHHLPCLQRSVREQCGAVLNPRPLLHTALTIITQPPARCHYIQIGADRDRVITGRQLPLQCIHNAISERYCLSGLYDSSYYM